LIIAAVADTHGKIDLISDKLNEIKPDYILFAGDYYTDGQIISEKLNVPASIVAGNCDYTNRTKTEEIITISDFKILLVHGHQYGVKRDLNRIYYRAREIGADAVVFGHTHSPLCEKVGELWLINPGSPVSPRLGCGSFALIEIVNNVIKANIIEIH
jgi:putative phosphoesterase